MGLTNFKISDFFEPEITDPNDPFNLGIAKISSISSGKDNGANNLMAGAFTNPMRHKSTSDLVSNINNKRISLNIDRKPGGIQIANLPITMLKRSELFIGGHGSEGMFETGAGNMGTNSNGLVYSSNYEAFETLKSLETRNTEMISIYSCYTGAGFSGAYLLFELAKLFKVPVRARTGLTISHSRPVENRLITFEKGSTWQLATPDMKDIPEPISSPLQVQLVKAKIELNVVEVKFDRLSFVEIEYIINNQNLKKTISDLNKVNQLKTELFGSNIFNIEGEIMGMVTAFVTLIYHDFNREKQIITIYNDTIAKYQGSDSCFYVGAGFTVFKDNL